MDLQTYESLGLNHCLWEREPGLEVNGRTNAEILAALDTAADRQYLPCSQAVAQSSAPKGTAAAFPDWRSRSVYPGTTRDLWVYTPSADSREVAPGIAVFQDGAAYLDPAGPVRATAVLDALIGTGELPPMVGVFINAGRPLDAASAGDLAAQRQRSVEYDSCTDDYARFLIDEVLPFVETKIGRALSQDPASRLVVGISSGGICAFNAAWHRPDAFGRVISHCGSFTNIRGGHNFPYLVRTTPRKPIRVFLQSGAGDADILYGNWPLANRDMAAALQFAGYEVRFEFGEGGHSLRHGGSVFADALRWVLA